MTCCVQAEKRRRLECWGFFNKLPYTRDVYDMHTFRKIKIVIVLANNHYNIKIPKITLLSIYERLTPGILLLCTVSV
jgi:hypothetical protein